MTKTSASLFRKFTTQNGKKCSNFQYSEDATTDARIHTHTHTHTHSRKSTNGFSWRQHDDLATQDTRSRHKRFNVLRVRDVIV